MRQFPFVYPARPAGAPVFTNPFLTPDVLKFDEYAWEKREADARRVDREPKPSSIAAVPYAPSDSGSSEFSPYGPGLPVTLPGRIGRPYTYADFLAQCPTRQQVQALFNDINIEFQPGTGVENLVKDRKLLGDFVCHGQLTADRGDTILSIITFVTKAFQTLSWVQFDKPMPIIGPKTPYEWIKSLGVFTARNKYRIFPSYSHFLGDAPAATFFSITDLIVPAPVFVYELTTMIYFASLILHEARHSLAGGFKQHTCNSALYSKAFPGNFDLPIVARNDWELGDGACGLEYWFLVWCRHHVAPGTWHQDPKVEAVVNSILDNLIQFQWDYYFCTHRHLPAGVDPSVYGPPPLDPSDADRRSAFPEITRPGGQLLSSSVTAPVRMPVVPLAGSSILVNKTPAYGQPMVILPRQPWMVDAAYQQALAQQTGVPWPILRMMAMSI